MSNSLYKPTLTFDEIVSYIMSINDSVDEAFFTDFLRDEHGLKAYAVLKEIPLQNIKPDSHKDNHLENKKIQQKYNKLSAFDPILVNSNFLILDGHHRYRAHLAQNKNTILVYMIINSDNE